MFVFKWFASSALIYIITQSTGFAVVGGFLIALVDHALSSDPEVVVKTY